MSSLSRGQKKKLRVRALTFGAAERSCGFPLCTVGSKVQVVSSRCDSAVPVPRAPTGCGEADATGPGPFGDARSDSEALDGVGSAGRTTARAAPQNSSQLDGLPAEDSGDHLVDFVDAAADLADEESCADSTRLASLPEWSRSRGYPSAGVAYAKAVALS